MTLNYNEQEIDPTRMVRSRVILTSEEQLNYFVKNFARLPTIGADLYTTDLAVRFIEPELVGQLSSVGIQLINTDLESKEAPLISLRVDIFDYVLHEALKQLFAKLPHLPLKVVLAEDYLRTKTLVFADEVEFVSSSDFFKDRCRDC